MTGDPTSLDVVIQGWVLAHQNPMVRGIFLVITNVGGLTALYVVALVSAGYFWRRNQLHITIGLLGVLAVAVGLFAGLKAIIARPRPRPLDGTVAADYAFPSGHATVSVAISCTLCYVLFREGIVAKRTAILASVVVPVLVGASRVYLNRHWTTDVLAGWLVGGVIAWSATALLYRTPFRRHA